MDSLEVTPTCTKSYRPHRDESRSQTARPLFSISGRNGIQTVTKQKQKWHEMAMSEILEKQIHHLDIFDYICIDPFP